MLLRRTILNLQLMGESITSRFRTLKRRTLFIISRRLLQVIKSLESWCLEVVTKNSSSSEMWDWLDG